MTSNIELYSLIGKLSKFLFGTASTKDFDHLREHVRHISDVTEKLVDVFQNSVSNFSSY